MKKRLLASVLALVMLIGIGGALGTTGRVNKTVDYADINITLNGKNVPLKDANGNAVEPFAIDGTTYIPVRAVSEALGLFVDWNQEKTEVVLSETPLKPDSGITDGTVNLYLVRHGKTIMNTMNLVQGWSDSPLTEAGRSVAYDAAYGMSNLVFDYAYSSDRGRAMETANIILSQNKASSNLTLNTMAGLRETNFGSYEGLPNPTMWNDLAAYAGFEDYQTWMASPDLDMARVFENVPVIDPTGEAETHEALIERMTESFDEIVNTVAADGGGNVLVVGHGASLLSMIGELTGETDLPAGLTNAAVSKLVWKDGAYTLEYCDNKEYLESGAKIRAQQEAPVTIYLTRHGKTHFNTTGQVQGWIDSPLTEAGREVATQLGKGLEDVTFSAVYTSGMGRTIETAQLVLAENKHSGTLPIQVNIGLRETNYGKFEGGTNAAMLQNALDYYGVKTMEELSTADQSMLERVLYCNYISDETGEAENLFELLTRVSTAFDEVVTDASENGGGNILVVAHGNAIMAVLEHLGVKDAGDILNASVTKITYQSGTYTIESVNDMSYVEAGAAK